MTVIAWDGKTLAVDRMMTTGGLKQTTCKLYHIDGGAMAFTGNLDSGMALVNWVNTGADPSAWPVCQRDSERWAQAMVIRGGKCFGLSQEPFLYPILDKFAAMGSGRDFAIAAMHCGKTAVEAVEIASIYEQSCGMGVDSCQLS